MHIIYLFHFKVNKKSIELEYSMLLLGNHF